MKQRQQGGFSRYSHKPQQEFAKESEEVRKAVDGLTFSRPTSSSQTQRPGPSDYQKRTSAGTEANKAKEDSRQPSTAVPRYVETEKQVLRFYCHFFEEEPDDQPSQARKGRKVSKLRPRLFTFLIFVEDFTVEIIEDKVPNSGMPYNPPPSHFSP